MAEIPNHPPEIARLLERSAASRTRLGKEVTALRQRLDAPTKALRSVRAHPFRWVGGAMATGLAAALLFRRRPHPAQQVKRSGGLLYALVLAAAKPAVKVWLTRQLKHFIASQLARLSPPQPTPLPEDPGYPIRRQPI